MSNSVGQPTSSTPSTTGDIALADLGGIRTGSEVPSTTAVPSSMESSQDSLLSGDGRAPKVSWLSLFAFTSKRHMVVLSTAMFLSTTSGLVLPGMSILMGKIFGVFAGFGNGTLNAKEFMAQVTTSITYLALLGCGSWLLNGAFYASWLWFGELQAKAAREKLFESLIHKELGWFEERKDGVSAMISKSQTEINELQAAVSQPLGYSVQSTVAAIASLGVAFYHSWSLTLVVLSAVPVGLGVMTCASARMQPHLDGQKENLSAASKTASSAISAIETVKAFNGQSRELSTFTQAVRCAGKAYKSVASLSALQLGFVRALTLGMFAQGFWYGSKLVRDGKRGFAAADIMTTFWSCLMMTQTLDLIMAQMILLEKGRTAGAGLRTLFHVFKRKDESCCGFGGYVPSLCSGDIEINGVCFAYPSRPSELSLANINLSIAAGTTTFIVGRSGSGKSTLGSLIVSAYQSLSGDILIDGHSIKHLDPRWIKEHFCLIPQQSTLFNETIFRNISFGRKDYKNVTKAQVLDACKMAALERAVAEFPRGLETIVSTGGKQLSGGQLQRVALARGRLRDPTVLILDEALSSLDFSMRRQVYNAIRKWRCGKTTIIVTHDISEIENNDFVYVMEEGTIIQQGYRKDLERRTGAFQSFVTASGSSSIPQKKTHPPPLSSITGFDPDFWNKSYSELQISPVLPEPQIQPGGRESPRDEGIFEAPDLEPSLGRGDRSLLEIVTAGEPLPASSYLSSSPRNSCLLNRPNFLWRGVERRESSIAQDGDSLLAEERAMLPKSASSGSLPLFGILRTVWPSLHLKSQAFLALGFTAAFFHAVATPLFSYALARLLGSILDTRIPESEARRWSLCITAIAIIDAGNCYLMHYLLEACGQSWVDHHRIQSFGRVLDQPLAWFFDDKNNVSKIIGDLEKHAEEMRGLVARFAGYGFVGMALTVIGTTWSFICSWRLTLVGLCIAPVMYGISRGMGRASDKYESRSHDAAQSTGSILYEAITSIRTVRNYSLERHFRQKYFGATNSALKSGIRRSLHAGLWVGLANSAILFATALIFYYGAYLVSRGQEDLKDILSVFTLLLFSLSSANTIVSLIPQISNCKDAALRVLRLSTLLQNSHEHEGYLPPPSTGAIVIKDVTFSYPTRPNILVLSNISLAITLGECIAIVGASGSGKSTLAALLQRLYLPTEGEITFDAVPLQMMSTRLLREKLAVVSQSPTLFSTSIAENITYGLAPETYNRDDIYHAAKAAGIHSFIISLPEGYNTVLGDNGSGLSAGQAQRVAIARALVRRPKVLVLDECTSNLDTESAKIVQESVARLKEKITVIIITHSRELAEVAHRVVGIKEGRIIEDGGPELAKDVYWESHLTK